MLSTYKKEEETNFKRKFDQLVTVGENRSKIKETIIGIKHNQINPYDDIMPGS